MAGRFAERPEPRHLQTIGGAASLSGGGAASLVADLARDLAEGGRGIEFVYRVVERACEAAGGDDAVLVVETEGGRRQAFHLGAEPVSEGWCIGMVRNGHEGLHFHAGDDGAPTLDPGAEAALVGLCRVALVLDEARHNARHDPLTGLLNRRAFDEAMAGATARAARYGWPVALVLVDIDGFKAVNDRYGHQTGDTVLRGVAARLRDGLRAGDVAARIGGDEFALVVASVDERSLPDLVARLGRAARQAMPGSAIDVSIGVATAPEDGVDSGALFRLADERLYEAKRS